MGNQDNTKTLRINEQIRAREIRLIDDSGKQLGIMPILEALRIAESKDLDLVEMNSTSNPPVCKIFNYGKYLFEQKKRAQEAKKAAKVVQLKEVRMQPAIDTGDLETKVKAVQTFLSDGNKVKVTIRFRGRQLAHTELGFDVLQRILDKLTVPYSIEKKAAMDGARTMSMTLCAK